MVFDGVCVLLQEHFKAFHAAAVNDDNNRKLFIMIVDECHYGATFQQAQDTYVNDYNWQGVDGASRHGPKGKLVVDPKQGPAKMLQRGNVLTLLVSATPYCMLTSNSRLPSNLYVSHSVTTLPEGLKQLDVLKRQQPSGQWGLDEQLSKSQQREAITLPPERVQELIGQQVRACGSRFSHLDCCCCCTSRKRRAHTVQSDWSLLSRY